MPHLHRLPKYKGIKKNPSIISTMLFLERDPSTSRPSSSSSSLFWDDDAEEEYIPEVLVVGAAGEVGRLVVQRMLLEGRYRIRVLVRNLYSQTLNRLGTGVTYCQGDLKNVESLEYALTDVDKIIFVAGAPRPDETDFQQKFQSYMEENNLQWSSSRTTTRGAGSSSSRSTSEDLDWDQLETILEVRAQLAEQVDYIGMQNLLTAYQNVRFADYGTSQAAKRTLFKFQGNRQDFNLFEIVTGNDNNYSYEETDEDSEQQQPQQKNRKVQQETNPTNYYYDEEDDDETRYPTQNYEDYEYASEYDKYNTEEYDDYSYGTNSDTRSTEGSSFVDKKKRQPKQPTNSLIETKCQWIRNDFGNGVFVGQVSKATKTNMGGEAAIISSRLRSRSTTNSESDDEDYGIDLYGAGFAGLIVRLCSDGGNYEAFIRTGEYETKGIEYICEFQTKTKTTNAGNKSRNKFITVRLPFTNFKPVDTTTQRQQQDDDSTAGVSPETTTQQPFMGNDIRNIGFRYRSSNNIQRSKKQKGLYSSFYLAFSYIKVYRIQPEPEFVYLSDARIPKVVTNNMVRHDIRKIITAPSTSTTTRNGGGFQIFNDNELQSITKDKMSRSSEETYYKFRGEELLKCSGLSYAIVRVIGFNENPSSSLETLDLISSNEQEIVPISRAEAAQVCVSTLLNPNALNKSFYVSKKVKKSSTSSSNVLADEDISAKFAALPVDPVI